MAHSPIVSTGVIVEFGMAESTVLKVTDDGSSFIIASVTLQAATLDIVASRNIVAKSTEAFITPSLLLGLVLQFNFDTET